MPFRPPPARPFGVGLGLRWAFARKLAVLGAAEWGPLAFLEVAPENFMRRGGGLAADLLTLRDQLPFLTHGLMLNIGGTDPLNQDYLRDVRRFLERMGAQFHTDHLCWTGASGRILHDLLPLPPDAAVVRHVVDRVKQVQDVLGVPLGLENISYYLMPPGGMAEGEFVARVVEEADCGLLLDVNNVVVNAINHGFDENAYVRALPLDRVLYLHVAGGERQASMDDLVIDTHGASVSDRVRALMARVIEAIGPVPVLYERDNSIPPLPELLAEVRELDAIYRAALARHCGTTGERGRFDGAIDCGGLRSQAGVERGLSRMIREPAPGEMFLRDPAAGLRARGVDPTDADHLGEWGGARLAVYRTLVRNGVFGVVRSFMPRTRARRGSEAFDDDLAAWMDVEGPVSPILAEVPMEFVTWIGRRWGADPSVPPYLADLAGHEVAGQTVRGAPDEPTAEVVAEDVALDAPLIFQGAARIFRYGHAVHELSESEADRAVPEARPTALLAYRDQTHQVRWLHLTRLAEQVLERLLSGATVRAAVVEGASAAGQTVDDDTLVRMTHLFADLGERKIVLGRGAEA